MATGCEVAYFLPEVGVLTSYLEALVGEVAAAFACLAFVGEGIFVGSMTLNAF